MNDLAQCFLKYQKTCVVYNELLKENRMLRLQLDAFVSQLGKDSAMEDKIRELAYLKWEAAGYPTTDGVEFWLQAEAELTASPPKTSAKSEPRKVAAKASVSRKK